jgi:hypothetical protein
LKKIRLTEPVAFESGWKEEIVFPTHHMIQDYINNKLDDLYLDGFEHNSDSRVSKGCCGFNFILNDGERTKG